MSMLNAAAPVPEVGETVATYAKYEGAQKAVSKLIEQNIPARDIAIVGSALRSIEKVTGRLGWARAAWQGALNGVMIGLLFAAFTIIWMPQLDMAMIGGILLIGVGFGMLFRILTYSIVRRRRDFASVMTVSADHYEVAVSREHVTEARRLLGTTKPRTQVVAPPSNEPPRYGIRVTDAPRQAAPAEPAAPSEPQAPATPETGAGPADPDGSAGPDEPRESSQPRD
ncbi:general stress protein [Microbacterium karelineae]|uniref:general stress protein n=1 Tax=Microbacterium karelineae TaxID=2654283 RepID=UPI0012EA9029|nr:general stress protein [Microbacterium karelineae]